MNQPYNPFDAMDFHFNKCILSGGPVTKDDVRPVFFDWIMKDFGIQSKQLNFLSGGAIEYQNFKVPISQAAMDEGLALILKSNEDLLKAGTAGINFLDPSRLYLYLVHLFYSVAYYEYHLAKDTVNDRNRQLFDDRLVNRLQMVHFFYQQAIGRVKLDRFEPGSVFTFKVHSYEGSNNFDFRTGLNTFTIALRIGDLGIMASLADNGVQKQHFSDYFAGFQKETLHPIQFDELYAQLSYKSYLMNNIYEYGIALPNEKHAETYVGIRIPENMVETPIYKDWEEDVFATVLANNVTPYGMKLQDVYDPNHGVATFLEDETGAFIRMDASGNRIG